MRLRRFRVQKFRSIEDSGWVDTSNITALIGINEAGKSNLMLPLWKLNPARDGEVDPLADYPRKDYAQFSSSTEKPVFITADFSVDPSTLEKLCELTDRKQSEMSRVLVSRKYGESDVFSIDFPEAENTPNCIAASLAQETREAIEAANQKEGTGKTFESRKEAILDVERNILSILGEEEICTREELANIQRIIADVNPPKSTQSEGWISKFLSLGDTAQRLSEKVPLQSPESIDGVLELVLESMPKFVYYSSYGNLDSEIYLPHVIENMQREDLGSKEAAKVRTLKVLFEFVTLSPKEIHDLGQEEEEHESRLTEEVLEEERERKKKRSILLQSASSRLTESFKKWWNQGDHRFRLEADGKHFRIWVSDDLRPAEVELPGRSTGLQWFFSFYLIFLVEAQGKHKNTILLLDEPGLSLHPLAQKDLSLFFENLSEESQLLYTTHSPFMVDPERLDRVKAVYVDREGYSRVSSDLSRPAKEEGRDYKRSIYPVNAAIGISSSDAYLLGRYPVIVEGESDVHFLGAMKSQLISKGLISPSKDMAFFPSSGIKGIKPIVGIVCGTKEELPVVIVDGDTAGQKLKDNLLKKGQLYEGQETRILCVSDFTGREGDEIEDLWPPEFIARIAERTCFRGTRAYFSDEVDTSDTRLPIVDQIEQFALEHDVILERGWKVELSKQVRQLSVNKADLVTSELENVWKNLFEKILAPSQQ